MLYQNYTPSPALAAYIRCYWSLEAEGTGLSAERDRIFPDGCMELIFHYGDQYKKYHTTDNADLQPHSFIHGQLTGFMEIEATGNTGIFSVRFHPGGLRPFIPFGLDEITDTYISIKDCWNKEGDILEDRMLNAVSNAERINILESFLLQKLATRHSYNPVIDQCVKTIIHHHGNITVDQLATSMHIGRRHLERQFIAQVGLSPKLLARITRFQQVLNIIESNQHHNLTSVAHQGGFYDQAHFIKDFKEFTGLNPKQYFSEELVLAKYFRES
ncbi:MAG: helix-turn-helix transcriptional regulator [Chitinophagaceae bacterium]